MVSGQYGPAGGGGDSFRDIEKERKRLRRDKKEYKKDKHRHKKDSKKRSRRRSESRSRSPEGHGAPPGKRARSAVAGARFSAPPAPAPAPRPPSAYGGGGGYGAGPPPSFLGSLNRYTGAAAPAARPTARFDTSGHEQANYLRCALCMVDSSGEPAFSQHVAGGKHRKRNWGRPGFAGLAPNAAGAIPPLKDPRLRADAARFGHDPDSFVAPAGGAFPGGAHLYDASATAGPWAPPAPVVDVPPAVAARVRRALGAVVEDVGSSGSDGLRDGGRARRDARPAGVPGRARSDPHGAFRRGLPVFGHRAALLAGIASLSPDAPCLLVEGETGSGKSTQVPQYVIEDACERNVPCEVLVTQPRRIAAIGVAERIAAERGEACGEAVGYAIRGEARSSPQTRLTFHTTGVALRRLQEDMLAGVTHIFVDEVHERTLEADFLLLALKHLVTRRGTENPLKVILMSATMPGAAVKEYFSAACPCISFPGRAFPVAPLFLEDALAVANHVVRPSADWHRSSLAAERRAKRTADRERDGGLTTLALYNLADARDYPGSVRRALADADEAALNVDLVAELVAWFAVTCGGDVDVAAEDAGRAKRGERRLASDRPKTGLAVLVFVVGSKEIDDVLTALRATGKFANDVLLPLHGGLPPEEQRRVFEPAPRGSTKIVVATNVAETSITIDDVAFVVDCGRVKEERYDPVRHMASLDDVYAPRASARQRRGRAGRVRAGLCVHLFPRAAERAERGGLAPHAEPEVRRVALEQLVLRLAALPDGVVPGANSAEACANLPEPPEPEAVDRAAEVLVAIGALDREADKSETLTELGSLLARLPIDARLGKLCIIACVFDGCLDDALTIAAALGNRSPFLSPIERRQAADAAKRSFANENGPSACGASDVLVTRAAYNAFDSYGPRKFDFARDHFLGIKTLQAIGRLKRQLLEALNYAGLVKGPGLRARDVEALGRRAGDTDGVRAALAERRRGPQPPPPTDALLASLAAAALFPQLATIEQRGKCAAEQIKLLIRAPGGAAMQPQKASVHPASVAAKLDGRRWRTPYAAFHERVRTTKDYVRDATPVPPLAPFLLTGCRLETDDDGGVTIDEWLSASLVGRGGADAVCAVRDRVDGRVADLLKGDALDESGGAVLLGCVEALVALEAREDVKQSKQNSKKKKQNRRKKRPNARVVHGWRPSSYGGGGGHYGGGHDW